MEENVRRKPTGFIFTLILIAGFCFYTYYEYTNHQAEVAYIKAKCSPVSTSGEEKELKLDSTIVLDLYNKVKTDVLEDVASLNRLDSKMRLYLAYRQIPQNRIYDSNCNQFSDATMQNYSCAGIPKAFKVEAIEVEKKKLFGEDANIPNDHIQLGSYCIGGYEYIESRGEYVQGECQVTTTTTFKVEKKLKKAVSKESEIVLYEDVKYYGNDTELPEYLKSGTYKYTFKLDTNYNYIYVNKERGE